MAGQPLPSLAVDILSDEDPAAFSSPSPSPSKKRPEFAGGRGGPPPPTLLVIDDDPTPQKPNPTRTPSFVAETPIGPDRCFDSDASVVRCSLSRSNPSATGSSSQKFTGGTGLICLDSDNESEGDADREVLKKQRTRTAGFSLPNHSITSYDFLRKEFLDGTASGQDSVGLCTPTNGAVLDNVSKKDISSMNSKRGSSDLCTGVTDAVQTVGESPPHDDRLLEDATLQVRIYDEERSMLGKLDVVPKQKGRRATVAADRNIHKNEEIARKKQLKEEKARLAEERKRKREEEKLLKRAMKAEAAEMKKLEKEKQKWEKGKFALKSIVAEIDAKVVENGSVGGHLLTRFAEKGVSYRITSNPIEKSILWKMNVPDEIAELGSMVPEVPYVVLVYQAEEFCDLVASDFLMDQVHRVRSQYPSFIICYLTNKLMSYINKCEQSQYKNPTNKTCWRRPPVEEVLSKLATHFTKVHSRQCIDEAEIAEHVVGLTTSLANCQFRKKLTWLSVNANGSMVPKDFIDRNLIKKSAWLKALIAVPKVQPRFAIAIWKKYPTMRSLLNVYMDPNRSVHEKEFLLKDLMIEGLLGKENRRLGEVCSKRIYRILMAQSGGIKTDDVEEGADFFSS